MENVKKMSQERMLELLAYAAICFANCANPFEGIHLSKKNIASWECIDLSKTISSILLEEVYLGTGSEEENKALYIKAEADFEETQVVEKENE